MDGNIQDFPESPFEPGHPVSPDKFKGRKKDINKISRYLPKVKNQGVPFHFFITGKRGMGKTSFVKYLANEICDKYDLTPVYINNDGISSLDEFIVRLIEALLKEFHEKSIGEQLFKFVSEYVEGFNVNGTGMKLREYNPDKLITHIKNDFPEFLIKISENLTDNNKGAFIFIDDLNGLSDNLEFASWYKRSFDTLNFADERIPIAFCLVSYPEEFNNLADINPSFTRIFERIIIDHIDDEDIEEFFETVFNDQDIIFDDDGSLEAMVSFTYGMPLVMQQIGESVFWLAEDNIIDTNIAIIGIISAAIELGNKQIRSKLDKIKSEHYENILMKICKAKKFSFKKSDVKYLLSSDENNVFSDCLNRVKELGIIESIGKDNSGEYEFSNRLYFVYFLIQGTLNEFKENYVNLWQKELLDGEISQEDFDSRIKEFDKIISNFNSISS